MVSWRASVLPSTTARIVVSSIFAPKTEIFFRGLYSLFFLRVGSSALLISATYTAISACSLPCLPHRATVRVSGCSSSKVAALCATQFGARTRIFYASSTTQLASPPFGRSAVSGVLPRSSYLSLRRFMRAAKTSARASPFSFEVGNMYKPVSRLFNLYI